MLWMRWNRGSEAPRASSGLRYMPNLRGAQNAPPEARLASHNPHTHEVRIKQYAGISIPVHGRRDL